MKQCIVSIIPIGASEGAVEQASKFLSGAYTWANDSDMYIYARISDRESAIVGVDMGERGVRFNIDTCNQALEYHMSKEVI